MSNIKSVKINNLLGGQGQNFFDPANPNKINTGSKITLKPKSVSKYLNSFKHCFMNGFFIFLFISAPVNNWVTGFG